MTVDGLLDTSVVVLLERLDIDRLPRRPGISAVTLAELSVGPLVTDDPDERAVRQVRLQETEASLPALAFDTPSARAFGHMAAHLRRSGRKPAARAFDVLIAATAAAHDMPLHTCNPKDVEGLPGLVVVPIPHPDRSPD